MPLYKYLHPSRIDVLENSEIRFSQPSVFNDPFELRPVVMGLESVDGFMELVRRDKRQAAQRQWLRLSEEERQSRNYDDFEAEIVGDHQLTPLDWLMADSMRSTGLREVDGVRSETVGILSLAEPANSLLMWAHYADHHRGFVIGFIEHHEYFWQRQPDSAFGYLRQVRYDPSRPRIDYAKYNDYEVLFVKSVEWYYEREWRMVLPLSQASRVLRISSDTIYLFSLPSSIVDCVILGCQMTSEDRDRILRLRDDPRYSDVVFLSAHIDDESFRLDIRHVA